MKLTRRAKETAKILVANETLHKHSPETLVLSRGDRTSEKLAWQSRSQSPRRLTSW